MLTRYIAFFEKDSSSSQCNSNVIINHINHDNKKFIAKKLLRRFCFFYFFTKTFQIKIEQLKNIEVFGVMACANLCSQNNKTIKYGAFLCEYITEMATSLS